MTTRMPDALRLPSSPTPQRRPPFPVVASVAPVVFAVVLWLVTRSPFVLMFAMLSPVIAVGGMLDGARSRRRDARRASAEHATALAALGRRVQQAQQAERLEAWRRHPSALDAFLGGIDDARRWSAERPGAVTVGTGRLDSALRLIDDEHDRPDPRPERGALLRSALTIDDMPVTIDLARGIGVVGPDSLVRAVLRGLLLQLCDAVPPQRLRVSTGEDAPWQWSHALPHRQEPRAGHPPLATVTVVHRPATEGPTHSAGPPRSPLPTRSTAAGPDLLLAGASVVRLLPPGCGTILQVRSAIDAEVLRSPGGSGIRFVPELVGEEQAAAHAALLARAGAADRSGRVPASVSFAELDVARSGVLGCPVGLGASGEIVVDLAVDGPHAVIGGTTGSGKSELLVTWIAGMAARLPPEEFVFLVVDFKGGATGAVLAGLPHCLGVVTDLDGPLSDRVLQSLGAEVRRREQHLAAGGVRGIEELPPGSLPRLVIVIDELAALLVSAPELHALLADIAARGRSLGMHLILCTQRPAGVVREALLANCALRIALRVNDETDSSAIIGVPDAARLPVAAAGRCLISRGGVVEECQVAETTAEHVARIARAAPVAAVGRSHGGEQVVRRPWIAPLPPVLGRDHPAVQAARAAQAAENAGATTGAVHGACFGLLDEPGLQRQRLARWPQEQRALLLHGGPRSGVTTTLLRLADELPGSRYVPADVEASWDALERAEAEPADDGALLLDDWDAVVAHWDAEHRQAAGERLARVLHDRRRRMVVAARRPGVLAPVLAAFDSRLILRFDDRADHVASGAPAALWSASAPAGRGVWQGLAVQVFAPEVAVDHRLAAPIEPEGIPDAPHPLLVVSTRPRHVVDRLQMAWAGRTITALAPAARPSLDIATTGAPVLVADPDGWAANGTLFAALRSREATVVFDACSLSEVRMIARTRDLPPAIRPGADRVWGLEADGGFRRWRLPGRER